MQRTQAGRRVTACMMLVLCLACDRSRADDATAGDDGERLAAHGQATLVEQNATGFDSPYAGPNSLTPRAHGETFDLTLYLGASPWRGAEVWVNPEVDQGFGLDDTLGVAGFPSGEAYKVGRSHPYLRLQRLFLRQTINLGGAREQADADANQLAGSHTANRLVLTAGKISVGDIFDTNQYAHDPRADFLNWTAIDAGTFDYAADAWGYTVGAAAEWYQDGWVLRAGLFDLSNVPNSEHLEPGLHELQGIVELERGYRIGGRPGRVRVTGFDSHGRMALLKDALALAETTGQPVELAPVRRMRSRLGADLNVEQQLTEELGLFARAGGAAGNVETYEFTDVDQAVSGGLSLAGTRWHRAQDTIGLALIRNQISAERQRYFAAGGLGILVGDGQLPHPQAEQILETYYKLAVLQQFQVTFDYQFIRNPAYNSDRGPVSVFALRLHLQL